MPPTPHTQHRSISSKVIAYEFLLVAGFFCAYYAFYFSPVWLKGGFLAPGDAALVYLPFFDKPWALWSDQVMSGYPSGADLQIQVNYLLKILLPSYNAFIISAYVVMALGTYAFVSTYTRSRVGGLFAGLVTSGSGFMIAHLGHATIIHAACWIPLILWALHRCCRQLDWLAVCVGAFAVALSLLGGHPQISIIGFGLAGAFWVMLCLDARLEHRAMKGTLQAGFAIFGIGMMLSAISVVPFVELASQGVRADWSIADFNSFSNSKRTLLLGLFPGLLGLNPSSFYGEYLGPWNLTELAFYAGIGPLILASVAVIAGERRAHVYFWAVVACAALIFSMGTSTPLGKILFHVPVLGTFRAQGRYGLVFIIAIAVLAGMAIADLGRRKISARQVLLGVLASTAVFCYALVVIYHSYPELSTQSLARLGQSAPSMGANPAIYIPTIFLLLSAGALIAWAKWGGRSLLALCFVLVVADLASFGMFYEWRYYFLPESSLKLPVGAYAELSRVRSSGTRVLPVDTENMVFGPFKPDSNVSYDIRTPVNYGPMLPSRVQKYGALDTTGHALFDLTKSPLLDVLGVGWLAKVRTGDLVETTALSRHCGLESPPPYEAIFHVPAGTRASRIRVTSQLACSTEIEQSAIVGVFAWSNANQAGEIPVRAGEDSSEWAIDRPGIGVKHRRAEIASTFDAGGYPGHYYSFERPFSDGAEVNLDKLSIKLTYQGPVGLRISHVDLVDNEGRVTRATPDQGDLTWTQTDGLPFLAERKLPPQLYWSVCAAQQARSASLQAALSTGALPDGGVFDPRTLALVESPIPVPSLSCQEPAEVKVESQVPGALRISTQGTGDSLLVISQSYYRGWQATIDGRNAKLIPVDGLIQGVVVPGGHHVVEVRFRPVSFLVGCILSLLGMLMLAVPLVRRRLVARRLPSVNPS